MIVTHYFLNATARSGLACPGLFSAEEYHEAKSFFRAISPTPLRHLSALASKAGVGDILLKDESDRLGLNAFKILGVAYAIGRLLSEGRIASGDVVVCATEGNHGRAVARAAKENGLHAKVYMSSDAAMPRREAIAQEGAQVVIVEGNYDDAVRLTANEARHNGWTVISDTSWPGYEEIPRLIMSGYTTLMDEAEEQWAPETPPDVVFVQAGVGGLACAVVSWLCHRYGARRPFLIACEPTRAACLLESARGGKPVSLGGPFDTIMAGLRCGEVSQLAWPTIAAAVDAFVAIDDDQCKEAMRILARPEGCGPVVVAGASGACGLAALLAILQDERLRPLREAGGIDDRSRVLVINTEGATDPQLYLEVTGRHASSVSTTSH